MMHSNLFQSEVINLQIGARVLSGRPFKFTVYGFSNYAVVHKCSEALIIVHMLGRIQLNIYVTSLTKITMAFPEFLVSAVVY